MFYKILSCLGLARLGGASRVQSGRGECFIKSCLVLSRHGKSGHGESRLVQACPGKCLLLSLAKQVYNSIDRHLRGRAVLARCHDHILLCSGTQEANPASKTTRDRLGISPP